MSFKILADTFSVARDSDHFIQLKTLKKPRVDDQVWLSFEIVGDTKFARSTVQNIIETVEEVYFDNLELDPYERFENTLKEVNLIYKNIKEKRGIKAVGRISAIIAIFAGNELHLTQSNDSEAYLIRRNKLSMISEGLGGKSEDLFVNIASGELLPEDKVVFSTSRLLRIITQTQLAQICSEGVTEALDSIRELVLADSDLSIGVACINTKLPHRAAGKISKKTLPYVDMIMEKGRRLIEIVGDFIAKKTGKKKSNINKNTILASILVITLLLIVSVSFLVNSQRNEALREEYKLRIGAMRQDINTANTKGYSNDKETANAILDKVEREARDILASNHFRSEALLIIEKIEETRDSINNIKRVTDTNPYVDLSQKTPDIKALGLLNLNDNFFAYEYNRLHEIILDQVLDPKNIDATEVVMAGTAMEDYKILVFLTQSGRIIEYSQGQFRFANTEDESWRSAVDISAYGRYIYLLSPSANQIYRYSRLRNNYSSGIEYNLDGDLSGAISMSIDGSIYVLKKGGEILRFFKGKVQPFRIEDLAVDISEATQIFTSPELDGLYILDPVNKRVIITQKGVGAGARYHSQLFFKDLDNIKSIYVEKNENRLYLLTSSGIYEVAI